MQRVICTKGKLQWLNKKWPISYKHTPMFVSVDVAVMLMLIDMNWAVIYISGYFIAWIRKNIAAKSSITSVLKLWRHTHMIIFGFLVWSVGKEVLPLLGPPLGASFPPAPAPSLLWVQRVGSTKMQILFYVYTRFLGNEYESLIKAFGYSWSGIIEHLPKLKVPIVRYFPIFQHTCIFSYCGDGSSGDL